MESKWGENPIRDMRSAVFGREVNRAKGGEKKKRRARKGGGREPGSPKEERVFFPFKL
jgi:hypothetical protein